MTIRLLLVFAVVCLRVCPASAAWLEAKTSHFTLYADTDEPRLRSFAGKLARYDAALSELYHIPDDEGRTANPVLIFAVTPNDYRFFPGGYVTLGSYKSTSAENVIFTQMLADKTSGLPFSTPEQTMLHEYTHYIMHSNDAISYPVWYVEGFAEFNSYARFEDDGSLVIGLPANGRGRTLLSGSRMNVRYLLDPPRAVLASGESSSRFYAGAWLLTHYLTLDPGRAGQLEEYLRRIGRGEPSLVAATATFGDLNVLNKDLVQYLQNNRFYGVTQRASQRVDPISIRALGAGEAAIMPTRIASAGGVYGPLARNVYAAAIKIAERYPNEAGVQAALAEAAYDAKKYEVADAAADRALKADPQSIQALIFKGNVAVQRARTTSSAEAAVWSAARAWYVRANRLKPNAARPLKLYYQSFVAAGQPPSAAAVAGLERAFLVAPQDRELRWLMAHQRLVQDDQTAVRRLLQPLSTGHAHDARAEQAVSLLDAHNSRGALAEIDGAINVIQ